MAKSVTNLSTLNDIDFSISRTKVKRKNDKQFVMCFYFLESRITAQVKGKWKCNLEIPENVTFSPLLRVDEPPEQTKNSKNTF